MQNKKTLFEKFKAKTPAKNKKKGIIATCIATALGAVLTAGVVTAPLGITLISIAAAGFGAIAVANGAKVEK